MESTWGIFRLALILVVCSLGVSLADYTSRQKDQLAVDNKQHHVDVAAQELEAAELAPSSTTATTTTTTTTTSTEPNDAVESFIAATSLTKSRQHHSSSSSSLSLKETRAQRKALRQARKGKGKSKSRRKRRGCKCMSRFMNDVEKLVDSKLKEFESRILAPRANEIDSHRVGDSLLRLSRGVSEAKKDVHKLASSLANLREEMPDLRRDVRRALRHMNTLDATVANLSQFMDKVDSHLSRSGLTAANLLSKRTPDFSKNIVDEKVKPYPTHCNDVLSSGTMQFVKNYYINIKPKGAKVFRALCTVVNNTGWTVIQKRQDGSVDFYKNWNEYKHGFGTLETEFWMGNDNIHYLTSQENMTLLVLMKDFLGKEYHAIYKHFRVDGEDEKYRLHISGYNGTAGDALNSPWVDHDGMYFSTKDMDNDKRFYDSCATHFHGAWWFNNCFEAHLNGKYYTQGFHQNYFQRDGVQWNTIHMYGSLKTVQMMVKPARGDV